MVSEKWADRVGLRSIPRAAAAWIISAAILCLLISALVYRFGSGERTLGYLSSLVSFIAAVFAGASAARCRTEGQLLTGVASAFTITLLLLTAGYLIGGKSMDPSGILSVVSFSFSGAMAGSVLFGKRKKRSSFRQLRK